MQLAHLALVLLSFTSSIPGHPTKPLDERSTELIISLDQTADGPRKKVVPKSIFVVPVYDRPCPDDMPKDKKGNCIQLHGIDIQGQLDFLFARVNEQLGNSKSGEDEEEEMFPLLPGGPSQIHIPIPRETYDDSNYNSETTERSIVSQITTTEVGTTTDITTVTPQPESTTTNTPTTTEWFTTTDKQTTTEPLYTTTTTTTGITSTGTTITSTEMLTTDSTTTEIPQYTEEIDSYTTFTVPLVYGDEKRTDFQVPINTDLFGIVNDNDNLRYPDVFASFRRPERDHRYFNHRNRDKNLWEFNPPWRETPDNTVVLVPKRNNDQDNLYRRLLHEQLSYLLRKNR